MGNQITCCSLSNPCVLPISISKSTTVIFPTGEVRLLHKLTKAAELMMEAPNFFIINAKSLKVGARFCCLNAEDDLQRASVYVMFPMQRKNSLVTADDLGAHFLTANSIAKRVLCTGNIKVQPESTSGEASQEAIARVSASVPRLSLDGVEELATPEFLLRRSMTRSKKPLLETIVEERTKPFKVSQKRQFST
ncbi:hypothetical protein K2173_004580 [Erythroxylum novogranatense]|uniref:Uncharacterized protein n=1 Tax=Erythroxylum novogranatense TaxID=1862640 RepID=A0AAV8T637_9ROSI|nr:hypothetical protein K2173_004580 [Erythroxylum novogranatense]